MMLTYTRTCGLATITTMDERQMRVNHGYLVQIETMARAISKAKTFLRARHTSVPVRPTVKAHHTNVKGITRIKAFKRYLRKTNAIQTKGGVEVPTVATVKISYKPHELHQSWASINILSVVPPSLKGFLKLTWMLMVILK